MNITLLSSIVSAAGCFLLAVFFMRRLKDRLHLSFALLSSCLFIWNGSHFLYEYLGHPFWLKPMFIGIYLIPSSALYFTFAYLDRKASDWRPGVTLTLSAGFIIFLFTPFFQYRGARNIVALAFHAFVLYYCLYLFTRRFRKETSPIERSKLKYIIAGGTIAVTAGLTDLIPRSGVLDNLPKLGNTAVLVFLVFISLGIIRYGMFNLSELLTRGLIAGITAFCAGTLYGLFIIWIDKDNPLAVITASVVFFISIIILYNPVRSALERQTEKLLFQSRLRFRDRLSALTTELWDETSEEGIKERVEHFFKEEPDIGTFETGFFDKDGRGYRTGGDRLEDDGLYRLISDNPEVITLSSQSEGMERITADFFRSRGTEIIIPVTYGGKPLGTFNLGIAPGRPVPSREDYILLEKLGEQAGTAIENARKYENMQRRDRLASLGEMAAGIAHEIRTPLGAIKGAAQLIEPSAGESENREYLDIIIEEVNRLNRVIADFLEYAKPFKKDYAPLDLKELVGRTVEMIRIRGVPDSIEIAENLHAGLPPVRGDSELIRQVFMNLIDNAVEAMSGGGRITIEGERDRDNVKIAFTDTGPGISDSDLPRIFDPFFTTREGGTGLGLAISHKIMEMHGGNIEAYSGDGTSFVLRFPLRKTEE